MGNSVLESLGLTREQVTRLARRYSIHAPDPRPWPDERDDGIGDADDEDDEDSQFRGDRSI